MIMKIHNSCQVAGLSTIGASAVFVVNSAGVIVWREQFGQKHSIKQGQLEAQIKHVLEGTPLIKVPAYLCAE